VRRKLLIEEIDQVIVQAHDLQVSRKEFLELIDQCMEAHDDKRKEFVGALQSPVTRSHLFP